MKTENKSFCFGLEFYTHFIHHIHLTSINQGRKKRLGKTRELMKLLLENTGGILQMGMRFLYLKPVAIIRNTGQIASNYSPGLSARAIRHEKGARWSDVEGKR